jgi:anti-sigma B factor antagonist
MTGAGSPVRSVRWEGPDGRVMVVEAQGDIDLHRSAQFQHDLLEPLERSPQAVIVDLSGVPYMDSSGVASLVKLLARVRRDKIALKLAGLTPRVRSVFEITRLDSVFEIYPSVQEALGS